MKKAKAIFITFLVFAMIFLITLGLYELKIGIWKLLLGGFAIAGFILAIEKFYHWMMDDGPLDCVDISEEDDLGGVPLGN